MQQAIIQINDNQWLPELSSEENALTHCALVMPFDDIDLGKYGPRKWLVTSQHQAITSTNAPRASQEMLMKF